MKPILPSLCLLLAGSGIAAAQQIPPEIMSRLNQACANHPTPTARQQCMVEQLKPYVARAAGPTKPPSVMASGVGGVPHTITVGK